MDISVSMECCPEDYNSMFLCIVFTYQINGVTTYKTTLIGYGHYEG
jgi:hypothetical protein